MNDKQLKGTVSAYMPWLFAKYGKDDVNFYIEKIKEKKDINGIYEYIWEWLENANSREYYQQLFLKGKKKKEFLKYGDSFYKSEFWKVARLKVLKRDRFSCVECGAKGLLHVHHIKYRTGSNARRDLITLCKFCHAKKHPVMARQILKVWEQ